MVGKITGNQLSSPIILSGSFSGSFVGDGSGLTGTGGGGGTPTLQQVTDQGASTTNLIVGNITSASLAEEASNNFETISYNNSTFNITAIRTNGGQQTAAITNVPSASHAHTASYVNPLEQNVIISGSLNVTSSFTASGLNYPSADGIDGSVIVSDGLGNLSMGHGERLVVQVRNNESFTITAGTPLHTVGSVGGSTRVLVVTASADSSHSDTMPAFGIAATDLTPTGDTKDGYAVITGIFPDYNITLASGSITVEEGQILYVGQNGGLTNVKPDTNDQNLIQNVGIVLQTNGTLVQNLQVSAINRTNDVPNLNQGNIFFGSGSNYAKIHISGALDQTVINNITASGDISASGDVIGNRLIGSRVVVTTGSITHITNINEIRKDADTFIRLEDSKITLNSFGSTANSILEIGSLAGEESFVVKADTIKLQSYGANPIITMAQGTNSTRFHQDVTGSGALLVTSNEINFTNLPTSDPGIVGRLYRDGAGNVKISI